MWCGPADARSGANGRLQQRRTQVVTLLQLFDAPAMVGTCGKRSLSTVPLQPLALLRRVRWYRPSRNALAHRGH